MCTMGQALLALKGALLAGELPGSWRALPHSRGEMGQASSALAASSGSAALPAL